MNKKKVFYNCLFLVLHYGCFLGGFSLNLIVLNCSFTNFGKVKIMSQFVEFGQVKIMIHFADSGQVKIMSRFADFGQVEIICPKRCFQSKTEKMNTTTEFVFL